MPEGEGSPLSEPTPLPSRFDLIANGGASLTLHFERAPFMSQERTVWLPWNSFYAMDTLVMKTEENSIPSCDLSGFVRPDPIIISSPLSTFFSAAPAQNPIVPETQVGMAGTRTGFTNRLPPRLSLRWVRLKPVSGGGTESGDTDFTVAKEETTALLDILGIQDFESHPSF